MHINVLADTDNFDLNGFRLYFGSNEDSEIFDFRDGLPYHFKYGNKLIVCGTDYGFQINPETICDCINFANQQKVINVSKIEINKIRRNTINIEIKNEYAHQELFEFIKGLFSFLNLKNKMLEYGNFLEISPIKHFQKIRKYYLSALKTINKHIGEEVLHFRESKLFNVYNFYQHIKTETNPLFKYFLNSPSLILDGKFNYISDNYFDPEQKLLPANCDLSEEEYCEKALNDFIINGSITFLKGKTQPKYNEINELYGKFFKVVLHDFFFDINIGNIYLINDCDNYHLSGYKQRYIFQNTEIVTLIPNINIHHTNCVIDDALFDNESLIKLICKKINVGLQFLIPRLKKLNKQLYSFETSSRIVFNSDIWSKYGKHKLQTRDDIYQFSSSLKSHLMENFGDHSCHTKITLQEFTVIIADSIIDIFEEFKLVNKDFYEYLPN